MSFVYVHVREKKIFFGKDTYLRSALFYGVMFNAKQALLWMKMFPVQKDKIWSVVKSCCK